jgi:hypothetical protein
MTTQIDKNRINPGKYSYLYMNNKLLTNMNVVLGANKPKQFNSLINLHALTKKYEQTKNTNEIEQNKHMFKNLQKDISYVFNLQPSINSNIIINNITKLNEIEDTSTKPYTLKQISDINYYLHKRVKIIINSYNLSYKNNGLTYGFGDFIRGCYFLMQFCEEQQLTYGIVINHPIKLYLDIFKNTPNLPDHIYNTITQFEKNNFNSYIGDTNIIQSKPDFTINNDLLFFLKDQTVFNRKMFINTNAFPNNIISEKHKAVMQNILKPIISLENYVENTLEKLTLSKQNYEIIHIRFGDKYLLKNETLLHIKYLQQILNYLKALDIHTKYLLISDNEYIKKIIVQNYPFLKTLNNQITHTGENIVIDEEKLRNTMLEFYLMSHSSNIVAYSVYKHGSGFSKWCAETYSIPYVCKYIPE